MAMSAEQIGIAVIMAWLAFSLVRGMRRDLRGDEDLDAEEALSRRNRLRLGYPFMAALMAGLGWLILKE